MELDKIKTIDIVDTINALMEYEYVSIPPEDEKQINLWIDEIHVLSEKIDELHDNSY